MATIGIDLGTTNTAAAVDGKAVELAQRGAEARTTLPSVAAYTPSGTVVVGAAARRRRAIDAKNTIYSAKRIIGRGWFEQETREFGQRYPFELVRTKDDRAAFKTRGGQVTPVDVAAAVLGVVREQTPGEARTRLAVPAGFTQAQRDASAQAAGQAGFGAVELIDEPVATAWAYLARGAEKGVRRAAVYDLGGGTFNLAVIDCEQQPFKVLGHGCDLYLGGDDIDQALAKWAADELLRERRWELKSSPEVYDRLVLECERAKIRLSFVAQTRIDLSMIDPAAPAAVGEIGIGRALVEQLCGELVRRTFQTCDQVLHGAGLTTREIDAVFMAGGSANMPVVRSGVEAYFGCAPRCDYDPMEVVAIGASVARIE